MTLLFALFSCNVPANVHVLIDGKRYAYPANPRLADVLAPVALEGDWYWAGAGLYKLGDEYHSKDRKVIIKKLNELKVRNAERHSEYQSFIQQIESWQLVHRVDIDIDYELARIKISHNPRFENGDYLLNLSPRPDQIQVFGAIEESVELTYSNNTCIENYLKQLSKSNIASVDKVYVIQPNGKVFAVGAAYWNRECLLIMPGSQIYVPIAEHFYFNHIEELNWSIAKLSSNRILK